MDSFIVTLFSAVLPVAITALTALYLLRAQRRKLGVEADGIIVEAAGKLVENLQAEVTRLTLRVTELEKQSRADRAELSLLRCQMDAMKAENARLKQRVTELEAENKRLASLVRTDQAARQTEDEVQQGCHTVEPTILPSHPM